MMKLTVAKLAEVIKAEPAGQPDGMVSGVSTDTRSISNGDCFFAIAGENFDGHDYVSQAFEKGAVCAVVDRDMHSPAGKTVLRVDDTIRALGDLARYYRKSCGFKVIGITGSVGKTTVRQIVYHVLSGHFRVHQSPKNFNNDIGLPMTLLGADADDEIVVAELGTNYPGEIGYLTRIALPDAAMVTNVYPAHLEGFGSVEKIAQEKLSIAEGLNDEGFFLINGDLHRLVEICKDRGVPFRTFGTTGECDFLASDIVLEDSGSSFYLKSIMGSGPVRLPLAGPGNVQNAAAAWGLCNLFGLSIQQFAAAVETLPAVAMRGELLEIGTLRVLSDCYNANPASMQNALATLGHLNSDKKRRSVFICGDMAELGADSEKLHAELGAEIARQGIQVVVAAGRLATVAAEAAGRNADYNLEVRCFEDTAAACNNLKEFVKDNDIVLVKGSRSAKLETAIDKLRELFN